MNLQWTIDSVTTLSWRPDISFGTNDSRSFSTSASFNANPYDYVRDPLNLDDLKILSEDSLVVNSRQNKSLSYSDNKNINSQLQLFRRFGRKGRNVALSFGFRYSKGDNQNASLSAVHLYQQKKRYVDEDSTYQTNRYTVSDNNNLSYSLGYYLYRAPFNFPAQGTTRTKSGTRSLRRRQRTQRSQLWTTGTVPATELPIPIQPSEERSCHL